jgi:hypothetical protein
LLVATIEEDDDSLPILGILDAIPGAKRHAQLEYALADVL